MTITPRDRRALQWLGVCAIGALLYAFWPESQPTGVVAASADSIPQAERRLVRVRQLAGAVPGRQEALGKAEAQLAQREKGLIQAETANQAQAHLLEVIRRIARTHGAEIRGVELGPPRMFGDHYGEVSVSVSLNAHVEELVNVLADLTAQPELIATESLQLTQASEKQKVMGARLTIAGLVPRKLIPEKKVLQF